MYAPSLDITVRYDVPAELVWCAIVDDRIRAEWWPGLELEAIKGGAVTAETVRPGKKKPRRTKGTVTRVVEPEELRFTWSTKGLDAETKVKLLVTQQKHRAKLRVIEEGFPLGDYAELIAAESRDGWRQHFADLGDFLDVGENVRTLARRHRKLQG